MKTGAPNSFEMLVVVESVGLAERLNKVLTPGSRAIGVMERTMGMRFDDYMVVLSKEQLARHGAMFQDWIETAVKTRMRP